MSNVKQTQKMIPFITCEISLCQYVCELVLGVNVLDFEVIKSNSVGSGNVSHCRASSLYDHLDHCFVVFKNIQLSLLTRRIHVPHGCQAVLRPSLFDVVHVQGQE